MTGPVPPVPGGPAAGGGGGGGGGGGRTDHLVLGRALSLVVLAVVLGVVMLAVGSRPPVNTATTATTTTTTAPAHHGHRSATTTTIPHATVKVQVANGTTAPTAAAYYTARLQTQTWSTLAPEDTTTPYSGTSVVYYAGGQKAAAQEIASFLGIPATGVKPLTSSVPVSSVSGVDVLVVLGPDLADQTIGKAVGTTTTTS
ncbi:MAG: LytR C-terminal domain-containing protein [Acidimicrobiales bacterium]